MLLFPLFVHDIRGRDVTVIIAVTVFDMFVTDPESKDIQPVLETCILLGMGLLTMTLNEKDAVLFGARVPTFHASAGLVDAGAGEADPVTYAKCESRVSLRAILTAFSPPVFFKVMV